MNFKATPLVVPTDDPFANDALGRKQAVDSVKNLLYAVDGPFVVALNSPWGTGKTTFVRMLRKSLGKEDFRSLYFDAWKNDFATDPLVAFIGELKKLVDASGSPNPSTSNALETARKYATVFAKRAVPVAGKLATAGLLDLSEDYESALADLVGDSLSDAVDAYVAEQDLMSGFRETIQTLVNEILKNASHEKVIIFVDELDRCRPTYAVELLERIKHFFDVENVVFVLSLDKTQLAVSLGAVYGAGIDTEEYLRRFIDLEFTLPTPSAKAFTANLFARFDLESSFETRKTKDPRFESGELRETFTELSDILGLSLRAREECFTLFRVALLFTKDDHLIFPTLLATLAVLKTSAPTIYREFALDNGPAQPVVEFIASQLGGKEFLDGQAGIVLEADLIAAKYHRLAENNEDYELVKAVADAEDQPESVRLRAEEVVRIVRSMTQRSMGPTLPYIVSKLELAFELRR